MSTGSPIDLTLRFVAVGGNSDGGWLPGNGTPPPEYGGVGNRYVDVQTGNIYGPKTASGWPATPAFTLNLGNVAGEFANVLSRVPKLEVLTANQGAKITALEGRADSQADLAITHHASIAALETRVTTHDSEIDELQRLMGLNDTSLPVRMLAAEDELARLSSQRDTDIGDLNTDITEIRSKLNGNSSSITTLQETFTGFAQTWASDVTTLRSEFNGNLATLQQALNTQADANSATASLVTTLTAKVNGNTAAITEEATVRATALSAMSSRVTTMESKFGGNIATITQKQTTLASDVEAYAAVSETLTAELGDTKAQVTTTQQALANAETALASQITELTAATESMDGRITTTETAIIEGDEATLTAAQDLVATSAAGLQASINNETSARISAVAAETSARNSQVSSLNTSIGNVSAAVTAESNTRASVDGYLGSRYTLSTSVSAGGLTSVAGMEIASTSAGGRSATNYIAFFADRFYITHTASGASDVPFEVVGGVVKIKSAMIQNASIGTLNLAGEAVTVPGAAYGGYSATVTLTTNVYTKFMLIGTYTQGDGRARQQWILSFNGSAIQTESPEGGTLGAMSKFVEAGAGTHTFTISTPYLAGNAACGLTVLGVKR